MGRYWVWAQEKPQINTSVLYMWPPPPPVAIRSCWIFAIDITACLKGKKQPPPSFCLCTHRLFLRILCVFGLVPILFEYGCWPCIRHWRDKVTGLLMQQFCSSASCAQRAHKLNTSHGFTALNYLVKWGKNKLELAHVLKVGDIKQNVQRWDGKV